MLWRPVMNSRRAGMHGSEPTQWLSKVIPRAASRERLGVFTQSLPYACRISRRTVSRPSRPTASVRADLEKRFSSTVHPFLQTYCIACHGKEKPQAQLDLTSYTSLDAAAQDYPHLGLMVEKLSAKEMPPKAFGNQPPAAQRDAVVAWLKGMRKYEAERNAGDPGIVLARRLSNAEYDYTIRDMTGQNIRPTKEFPVDPANQEGFDNSGESLTVSPALMKKYLQAARGIADNLVLGSTGLALASHPELVEKER